MRPEKDDVIDETQEHQCNISSHFIVKKSRDRTRVELFRKGLVYRSTEIELPEKTG